MTKNELINKLQIVTAENNRLKQENELLTSTMLTIYAKTRTVLGIEQRMAEREKQRLLLNCTKD